MNGDVTVNINHRRPPGRVFVHTCGLRVYTVHTPSTASVQTPRRYVIFEGELARYLEPYVVVWADADRSAVTQNHRKWRE